jgi:quercetin dioxygenase-like cupin family protein
VPLVHDGEEGGIVISGRLEVTVDGERRILGPAMPIISRAAARTASAASATSPAR